MTSTADDTFTVLIEFDVPAEHQHEFAARLAEQIERSLPRVEGFRSATVQRGVDGRSVVNYARWTTRASWEAATGLDAAQTGTDAGGGSDERNWAETQQQQWFGPNVFRHNPVVELLDAVGGRTRRVTAFDGAQVISAHRGRPAVDSEETRA